VKVSIKLSLYNRFLLYSLKSMKKSSASVIAEL
jgi:hypothetical protein